MTTTPSLPLSAEQLDLSVAAQMLLDKYDGLRGEQAPAVEFELLRAALIAQARTAQQATASRGEPSDDELADQAYRMLYSDPEYANQLALAARASHGEPSLELQPLPEPEHEFWDYYRQRHMKSGGYTAEQMREYARASHGAQAPDDASSILLKLCDQLEAMKRTMFLRPGTGQHYSYVVHEDMQAYVEQARAALANRASSAKADGPLPNEPKSCRQCDESVGFVCDEHADDEADAYNYACELMEKCQAERAKRGVEVGTQGSLCDGIAWIYHRLEQLERASPAATQASDTRAAVPQGASVRDMLRWSGADTDYHGKIAFTVAQFEHFVSMLTAAPTAAIAEADAKEMLEPNQVQTIADRIRNSAATQQAQNSAKGSGE